MTRKTSSISIVYPSWIARRRRSLAALAVAGSLAAAASPAGAQSMPNTGAWLNSMIGMQMSMQRQGNMAVQNIYNLCITHPGACQPAPGALSSSIQALQNQYSSNFAASQRNYNSIYNTNSKFDIGVIQQRCWTQRQADGSFTSNC